MRNFGRLLVALVVVAAAVMAQVRVRGYVRRDGTYVQPHYRSNPDGNFYNNWSTKGNVNPYTGEPGTRVTPSVGSTGKSIYGPLLDYYRSIGPAPQPKVSVSPAPTAGAPWTAPPALSKLPVLAEALPEEEIARSDRYCGWLYGRDDLQMNNCRAQQRQVLASIVLPDYSTVPMTEVGRGGRYCEWLYGDNRASFYDCFNHQILGLATAEATFSSTIPEAETARSKRYCEWLYGDNRASYRQCVETQARQLQAYWPVSAQDVPPGEWQHSQRYCEWLYGNNRGSALQCLHDQAQKLQSYFRSGLMSQERSANARSYCQWLYNNNRASYWDCLAARK